jgi:hypothetical protein
VGKVHVPCGGELVEDHLHPGGAGARVGDDEDVVGAGHKRLDWGADRDDGSGRLAGCVGKQEIEMLPVGGRSPGADGTLLVDEEGEGQGVDVVALGQVARLLQEDREGGLAFARQLLGCFRPGGFDEQHLEAAAPLEAVEFRQELPPGMAPALGEDQQHPPAGETL